MKALWYRFLFGYSMVNAYLADKMGETDGAATHESLAREAERRLDTLRIQ